MTRITHLILLISFLPAFLMPTRVVVCLTKGIGSNCCSTVSSAPTGHCPVSDTETSKTSCCCCAEEAPETPSCCQSKDVPEEDEDGIRSRCQCCIAIENPQDDLEKSESVVEIEFPPLGPGLAVTLPEPAILCPFADTKAPTVDPPPRILPLLI